MPCHNFPTSGKNRFSSPSSSPQNTGLLSWKMKDALEKSMLLLSVLAMVRASRAYNIKTIRLSKIALLTSGSPFCTVVLTILVLLLVLHLKPIYFTSMSAYGDEPAGSLPIVINEVEISASSDQTELQWIELLNTGEATVSVSNLNLNVIAGNRDSGNTTQIWLKSDYYEDDADSFTLAAGDHNVVNIPTFLKLFDTRLITLQLFQDQVLLDEVEWINDNFADGRTWQRFPDGRDSGHFEDWIFADASKGENNGNMGQVIAECYLDPLCMNINIPMHKPELIDINGTTFSIDTFSTSSITNLNLDQNQKKISVKLSESRRDSSLSFIHLIIPKALLNGVFLVNIDNEASQQSFFITDNDTHSRLVIEYQPGDRTIEILGANIIPEFNSSAFVLMAQGGITSVLLVLFIVRRGRMLNRAASKNNVTGEF
jgi:hypothetical protein